MRPSGKSRATQVCRTKATLSLIVVVMVEDAPPSWNQTVLRAGVEATAAVPLIGSGLSGALRVVYDDVVARRQARATETLEDIVAGVGDTQTLAARLEASPQLDAMFGRAVEAAARTGLEAKRRLLARAVAAAACDDARLDDSELMIDTLSQLDTAHVRALARLNDEPPISTDDGDISYGTSDVWREQPAAIQATLVRTGAAKWPSRSFVATSNGQRQEGISNFGRRIVTELRSYEPQHDVEDGSRTA